MYSLGHMDLIQLQRSCFVLCHVKVVVVVTINLLFVWITSKVANSGTVWSCMVRGKSNQSLKEKLWMLCLFYKSLDRITSWQHYLIFGPRTQIRSTAKGIRKTPQCWEIKIMQTSRCLLQFFVVKTWCPLKQANGMRSFLKEFRRAGLTKRPEILLHCIPELTMMSHRAAWTCFHSTMSMQWMQW